MAHPESLVVIALSMRSPSLRARAIALEILAAICLMPGGHKRVLECMLQFAKQVGEHSRFQTVAVCLEADVYFRGGYSADDKFERIIELQVILMCILIMLDLRIVVHQLSD